MRSIDRAREMESEGPKQEPERTGKVQHVLVCCALMGKHTDWNGHCAGGWVPLVA
jgi:hypothetical protein